MNANGKQPRRNFAQGDPRETLKKIAACAPLIAVMLARQHGIPLDMTPMSIGHALAEIEEMRTAVMRYHANGQVRPEAEATTNGHSLNVAEATSTP
ncbi:MAG: hypothetical protein ACREDO_09600 [Methyloceanibacter sp.]